MNYHYSVIVRFLFLIFFFGKGSVSQAAEGLVQCRVTNALPHPPRLQIGASGELTEFTDFTKNQNNAMKKNSLAFKTRPTTLNDQPLADPDFTIGMLTNRPVGNDGKAKQFYKIYSDNLGANQGGVDNFKGVKLGK